MKNITNINQGGIDPKLPLETATLKGEMEAQTGINHQAIKAEETSRGELVKGPTAGPVVNLQYKEIAGPRIVFGVEIII